METENEDKIFPESSAPPTLQLYLITPKLCWHIHAWEEWHLELSFLLLWQQKKSIIFSSQLTQLPEQYISHYEVSYGRVLIYFNEVKLKSIYIHKILACPILKVFFSR